MNNILVVSGDRLFLEHLDSEFQKIKSQYLLFTADSGPTGLEILTSESIDFVAASLSPPQMDGVQFLTNLRRIKPAVPTVVMTSTEATHMGDSFLKLGVLKVLIEPVTAKILLECIQEVLFLRTQQGRLQGISIINFLQLIEMEKKTYLLEVRNQAGAMGLFYFHEGVLFDALCGELTANDAALEMITWENVEIHFRTPPTQKVKRRIKKSLMSLLMDGVLLKDKHEEGVSAVPDEAGPSDSAPMEPVDAPGPVPDGVQAPEPVKSLPVEKAAALPEEDGSRELSSLVSLHLQEFYNLQGVKAALLINPDGQVSESVGSWPGSDLSDFSAALAVFSGGAGKMIRELNLTGLRTMVLESEGAVILCLPTGDKMLAILAPDSRTLGIIRQKALKLSGEIKSLPKT